MVGVDPRDRCPQRAAAQQDDQQQAQHPDPVLRISFFVFDQSDEVLFITHPDLDQMLLQ
jgi:hypothetical protein